MEDFNFRLIAPRCGGLREAFEELCCQLARRTLPEKAAYTRLRGAGGDGGVECFADLPDGSQVGWQAKYVFNVDALIAQATESLTTALEVHPLLRRYVVCFPFDLTGPTGRRGRSEKEKFDAWCKEQERIVSTGGRQLSIEAWSAHGLRSLLLLHDTAGGIREYFFNQKVLSNEWFLAQLELAKKTAGPRYTAELNVETSLWKWFAAFGRTSTWSDELNKRVCACRQAHGDFSSAVRSVNPGPMSPAWPTESRDEAQSVVAEVAAVLDECAGLTNTDSPASYRHCLGQLHNVLEHLVPIESLLADKIDAEHGQGRSNSTWFRQHMAEYMATFPAANLDCVRDTIKVLRELQDWLESLACSLAFERAFVLTGASGSGKTHGICDAVHRRMGEGLLACIVFGHEFRGEPHPWTRMLESLGLPITLGMEGLLDALNAAGESSGYPLVIFIDAINETRPLRYWRDRLSAVVQTVSRKPYLRLCVACRTSFVPHCLPEGHGLRMGEHRGFAGVEREACRLFFEHHGLEPPLTPILQPELANPLYLRLLCKTLQARGLRRLPPGWHGLSPVIQAFLDEMERQFSAEYETSIGERVVSGSLRAIARAIADTGDSALPWTKAQIAITAARPQTSNIPVLEWLVRADLLIDDAPTASISLDAEGTVRPAFERFGDFLIAGELMEQTASSGLDKACQPGGILYSFLNGADAIEQKNGIISALSILLSEKESGLELPNLFENGPVRDSLTRITIDSFPWRDPATFSLASGSLIRRAFHTKDLSGSAMDALLSVAWQPSAIDAFWLDTFLKGVPLARRDEWLCGYLHQGYESHGPVRQLIEVASDIPLDQIERDVAERWATLLLWFNAAADRRVKDRALRAATAILTGQPGIIPNVLDRLLDTDDDELRERVLLSCYGALITSRGTSVVGQVTSALHKAFKSNPVSFGNALIRDHIRCITELAQELGVLPGGSDPEATMRPIDSEWPLGCPSDEDLKRWEELPALSHSCLHDDFFIYSMGSLRPWEATVPKQDMGKWILKRVASDFGYEGSGCERYDGYMLGRYGGGRGKPTWAERIGKKYQWVAMYQLASRLSDHVERKRDSWEPEPRRFPLILLEERKLDPTLPAVTLRERRNNKGWWVQASAEFQSGEGLSDEEWVTRNEDLPDLKRLLSIVERGGQRWRLLTAYPSWGSRDEKADSGNPYRHVWMHIEGYLIPKESITSVYNCLHRRNFFGQWMRQGATWLYGFAGEYPWATPYNSEPEEWYGRGGYGTPVPFSYLPCWNDLAVEWEYDSSLENFHMHVPARSFFSRDDLWWNSNDGYRLVDGRTVFRDPSVTEKGPGALIADADDLLERLDKLNLCLLWTVLGEKRILGGRHDTKTPRRTFSQVARIEKDGSLHVGERVFFENYDQDTGPLPIISAGPKK